MLRTEDMSVSMMINSAGDTTAVVVTLVLRAWRGGPSPESADEIRYEARHVQTGEVAYFRSLASAAQHIRCLVERVGASALDRQPIQFPSQPGIDPLASD
jgi:hypothetical protein